MIPETERFIAHTRLTGPWHTRLVGFAALLCTGSALANGAFGLPFDDVDAAGRGFTGAGFQSIARNPAAVAGRPEITAGSTLAYYETRFNGTAQRAGTDDSIIQGSLGGNPGRLDIPLPDFSARFTPYGRWQFGLALAAPYGITLRFDEDWVGRYHAIDTIVRGIELLPSVSFVATDTLTIGFAPRIHTLDLEFTNDVDLGAVVRRRIDAQGGGAAVDVSCAATGEQALPGKYDFRNRFETRRTELAWQAGLIWQAIPTLRLAASYRSKIKHRLEGTAIRDRAGWTPDTFRNDGCFDGLKLALAAMGRSFEDDVAQPAIAASSQTSFSAPFTLPETVSADIAWDLGNVTLSAAARWTRWSRVDTVTFTFGNGAQGVTEPVRFDDSALLGLGIDWRVSPTMTLRIGGAFEESTVDDKTRTARAPDANRRYGMAGLSWQWRDRVSFDLAGGVAYGDARQVRDLAEATDSGNVLNGRFEPLRLVFGSARLRWAFE